MGLIGGSIGLAARERLGAEVTGWDPSPGVLDAAVARGALDRGAATLAEAVSGAEVVFVAAPVGQLTTAVEAVLDAIPRDCVVTDVGSTKRSVVAEIDDPRFVGGHPLAGAETAGVEHARGDLFQDAVWYLTPSEGATGVLFERLHRLLRGLGARPTTIDAATHDTMLAAVSHLPHVVANVLVAQAARALEQESEQLPATGPSFRDATRVAGANSAIWTDIYMANRDALIERIDDATRRLGEFRALLESGDDDAVARWNDAARADRERLLEAQLAGGPLHELRASVPNEPGVVARLALELGRAGVNITDMALYPAPNQAEGVVALWIAGDEPARRALELVEQQGFPVARA
ncbi:prephenate dehydrogenase/arogenate dehydrogenase family protein [Conexibacter sp. CPCC 206217]|uniref:prephenate dehydrogenase/arogenate dehydrogenase family protein n=1 Tax=Conexibacter sp. CPCC 206217 TaxID=3064574 RepID=UPI0027215692|nr:prephenate dehydrogenase/arogenate dehydrogenase family protein [Conexibacter sp. CPCC 206217]MDO8212738.1 prephenate dehydrogenase/arogenate dehydrogenase family protein [Conexibacter sp. CPCC 206217]